MIKKNILNSRDWIREIMLEEREVDKIKHCDLILEIEQRNMLPIANNNVSLT